MMPNPAFDKVAGELKPHFRLPAPPSTSRDGTVSFYLSILCISHLVSLTIIELNNGSQ